MGQLNMKEDIGEATIVSPYISLTKRNFRVR